METNAQLLKTLLETREREVAIAHQNGAGGFETCAALSRMMDEAIHSAFNALAPGQKDHIAILALGGYGRVELCPKSDVDVMVLCASGVERDAVGEAAKSFLHLLWDAGVDVGHSVRTVEEALALHETTLDAWTSMLEGRFICGNAVLADSFFDRMKEKSAHGEDTWFIEGVFADQLSRHERYGSSVKLLEPNIKKSAGGLRDIQAIFWLHRGTDPHYFTPIQPSSSAIRVFLKQLLANGVLEGEEHSLAEQALQFLYRVRHEMHYQRESLHDTLEYTLQVNVAEGLGYGTSAEPRSVEVFMRDYYLHARTVHRLSQQLGQRFRELIEPPRHISRTTTTPDKMFHVYDDVVSVDPSIRRFKEPGQLFDAFSMAAEHEVELDFRIRNVIERSADLITQDQRSSAALGGMFRRVLRSGRVAATLREMNELNVLGKCIPEFGDLVAFFQHNVYHFFTADEHTLMAIANAEKLREQPGILHEVFRNLRRKDILYLAILLHDIAKPHGVADHEITGVEMARTILHRLGMDDLFPLVGFLVRNHLAMEQTAFRRNIHDPATIKEFTEKFESPEQLDYLYVLTYADLSAVNTGVWTEWKSTMLQELYQRTTEVLRRNLRGSQIDRFHQARQEAAVESIVDTLSTAMPREAVERHLQGMQNDSYIALFSEQEIEQHILKSAMKKPVSTVFLHSEGYTEVTVIAQDAPFALSRFCAVLAANDANIFDANIFTKDDGTIIDRFRVSDASTKQKLEQRVCDKIAEDLKQVTEGMLDIEHLFLEHRRKWKRRPKWLPNANIRTDVQFEDNPKYTIIDVYAPDAVGFLYRVTETISRIGLDIYFAKIATRVDGIVDAFYTLDRSGKPVTDPARREGIRTEILDTITRFSEQELE